MDLKVTYTTGGYRSRTISNVLSANVTIAFAVDFSTSGEKLTHTTAVKYNKPILRLKVPTNINDANRIEYLTDNELVELLNFCKSNIIDDKISINIAGNAIQRFVKYKISQQMLNNWMTSVIKYLKESLPDTVAITIRSGGQTGSDIAGIIAGLRNNIPCTAHFPHGYLTRNEKGIDMTSNYDFIYKYIIRQV